MNYLRGAFRTCRQWFDADYFPEGAEVVRARPDKFEWRRCPPLLFLHAGCIGVLWVEWSWAALIVAAVLYFLRTFAIMGFYHRYFSHRAFRTSRTMQFFFALAGNSAMQRGPLWWAAVHRHHHQHSDEEPDVHSPGLNGFWWSHIGWMTSSKNFPTNYNAVRDLVKFPELVFLNRFDLIVPGLLALGLWCLGAGLAWLVPGWHTTGMQMLVWGFFVSTVAILHATFFVNSLAHVFGRQRFKTGDDSRNSFPLALITLGEGWHNNHHRYMNSARQGFFWWEVDVTYYLLVLLSWTGLIWDLKQVPDHVYDEAAAPGKNAA